MRVDWIALVVSVVAAGFTGLQWIDARDTAKRDLRAYVAIEPQDIGLLTAEVPVWTRSRLINFCKTPALHVRHVAVYKVLPNSLPENFRFEYPPDEKDDSPFVLHPTQSRDSERHAINALTTTEVEKLRSDRYALYAYGIVSYEDIFGEPHKSTYCIYVKGSSVVRAREQQQTGQGKWWYADQYNDAD